ncbi:MAG: hypothetical protein H7144_12455 [Burkholderiales bacterium]|nr:hypothetical protein [Phycisphaerae bacterium]
MNGDYVASKEYQIAASKARSTASSIESAIRTNESNAAPQRTSAAEATAAKTPSQTYTPRVSRTPPVARWTPPVETEAPTPEPRRTPDVAPEPVKPVVPALRSDLSEQLAMIGRSTASGGAFITDGATEILKSEASDITGFDAAYGTASSVVSKGAPTELDDMFASKDTKTMTRDAVVDGIKVYRSDSPGELGRDIVVGSVTAHVPTVYDKVKVGIESQSNQVQGMFPEAMRRTQSLRDIKALDNLPQFHPNEASSHNIGEFYEKVIKPGGNLVEMLGRVVNWQLTKPIE